MFDHHYKVTKKEENAIENAMTLHLKNRL